MINENLLVNDGLDPRTCTNNGAETWTYNQGVVLGGLVALCRRRPGTQDYLDAGPGTRRRLDDSRRP